MRPQRICIVLVLILAIAQPVFPADTTFSQAEFQKSVSEFTLANGMKFLVVERHGVPVVAFDLYVDVGAVDETSGMTGVSHVFEHMAFKGTRGIGTSNAIAEKAAMDAQDKAYAAMEAERLKGAQSDPAKLKQLEAAFSKTAEPLEKLSDGDFFSKTLERNGAQGLNAGTTIDFTEYTMSMSSNKLELWFSLESGRFLDPVLREFYKERDVVLEERNMRTESSPNGKLIEEFLAVAYKAHPYGQPVVGHRSEVSVLRRPEAEKYFKDHYVASALTACVVGDVNPKEVKRLAEMYFGRLPKRPRPEAVRTVEPPQEGERRVEVEAAAQPLLILGYHKPSIMDKDRAVFSAIDDILGGGRTSWLYKSLVREKKLAVSAQAGDGFPGNKYPNLFVVFVVPSQGHTAEEDLKAVEVQIERLKTEKISPEVLEQVKTRTRAAVIRGLQSMEGLASVMASTQAVEGDWKQIFKDIDEIGKVTADDIQRVAKTYLQKKNRTIGMIVAPEKKS